MEGPPHLGGGVAFGVLEKGGELPILPHTRDGQTTIQGSNKRNGPGTEKRGNSSTTNGEAKEVLKGRDGASWGDSFKREEKHGLKRRTLSAEFRSNNGRVPASFLKCKTTKS